MNFIFIFCLIFLSQTTLASDLKKAVQEFKSKAQEHWSGTVKLTQKEIDILLKSLAAEVSKHLLKTKINFREQSPHSITLSSNGNHELNVFSKKMHSKYQTKVSYNLRYLFDHPYAEASFNKKNQIILLPHSAIIDTTPKIQSVEHESVHAKVFYNLTAKKPMPYYGYFSGNLFKPNDLYLDEMYAYFFDLKAAAKNLHDYLKNPHRREVDLARLKLIISEREKEHPPQLPPLTKFEYLFDSIVKNVVFGKWHTDPASKALKSLIIDNTVLFSIEYKTVVAKIRSNDLIGTFLLIDSKSTDSKNNHQLLRNYVGEISKRVKEHQQYWSEAQELYREVANSKIEDRINLLRKLTRKIRSFYLQ